MKIREIMTENPVTAGTNSALSEIGKLMEKWNIGCVPILENSKLVGVITDRDLVVKGVAVGMDLASHTAREIMSTDLHTVNPDTDTDLAANLMIENKIRRLPVIENNQLVGIVTLGDLAVTTHDAKTFGHVLEEVSTPIGPNR